VGVKWEVASSFVLQNVGSRTSVCVGSRPPIRLRLTRFWACTVFEGLSSGCGGFLYGFSHIFKKPQEV
jgi:hypothetical protein